MKYLFLLLFLMSMAFGQENISGRVLTPSGDPLFAANVFSKSNPSNGVITDGEGYFSLDLFQGDTLLIAYPGYNMEEIPLQKINQQELLLIKLKEKSLSLKEVSIKAERPISEEFSVVRLEKLDIYLNPISAADPLRAIGILPASTNTQESANPALRGAAADRSRVILNGVPIYQPVRNSQINGLGNFSLFNTELLEAQYVYASNPPLTFGNSSGGLVQIETTKKIPLNSTQFSLSLANVGLFRNQKLGEKAFAQVYGNYQFSKAFTSLQPLSLSFLKSFSTKDLGLHFFLPLSPKWQLQSVSYGISESYEVESQVFAHRDEVLGSRERSFHIFRLQKQGKNSIWSNQGSLDLIQSNYNFGNLRSLTQSYQGYFSSEYKAFVGNKFTWQGGINYDYFQRKFNDSSSVLYYSNRADIPTNFIDSLVKRPLLEGHLYGSWTLSDKLKLSAGLRSNIPLLEQTNFWSYQSSIRWNPFNQHSFLLSAGRYHSYALPNFFLRANELLKCDQLALDYSFRPEIGEFSLAFFAKKEKGLQNENFLFFERSDIFGMEGSADINLGKYLKAKLANTFLFHRISFTEESQTFNGGRDLPYFIKASLAFNHPRWFNLTAVWQARAGTLYTPIMGGKYRNDYEIYEPIWPTSVNSQRLPTYQNLSLSISRYQLTQKGSLILFFSINNVFNRLNPRDLWYEEDFSGYSYAPFSLRTIYFGLVYNLMEKNK